MKDTSHHDDAFAKMTFGAVYPHYVTKIEKKLAIPTNDWKS